MEAVTISTSTICDQLTELLSAYSGLAQGRDCRSDNMVVRGLFGFSANSPGLEEITDRFDLEISIPANYPLELPVVKEVSGRIKEEWGHINPDGTLCLAVPMDQRTVFNQQPSLLGFADNLIVPYLYGYCFWEKHGTYPFGEARHGGEGVMDYYKQLFTSSDEQSIVLGLYRAYKYGYRGHHPCPCGSQRTIRQCHKNTVWDLTRKKFRQDLVRDINIIISNIYVDQ